MVSRFPDSSWYLHLALVSVHLKKQSHSPVFSDCLWQWIPSTIRPTSNFLREAHDQGLQADYWDPYLPVVENCHLFSLFWILRRSERGIIEVGLLSRYPPKPEEGVHSFCFSFPIGITYGLKGFLLRLHCASLEESNISKVKLFFLPFTPYFFSHFCAPLECCNLSLGSEVLAKVFLTVDGCSPSVSVGRQGLKSSVTPSCWHHSHSLTHY